MKLFGQLVDECMFEARIKGSDPSEAWFALTIKEILDKYTAYVSYPDLFRPFTQNLVANPFGNFTMPTDFQRLDYDNVSYIPEGDITRSYQLKKADNPWVAEDTGIPQLYTLDLRGFSFFPTEWTTGDQIIFNYWRTGSSLLTDYNVQIKPDILVNVVKNEVIAQANLVFGLKNAANYMTLAKDARVATFGALDLPPMN